MKTLEELKYDLQNASDYDKLYARIAREASDKKEIAYKKYLEYGEIYNKTITESLEADANYCRVAAKLNEAIMAYAEALENNHDNT